MGTDIHSYLEWRSSADSPWQLAHPLAEQVSDIDPGKIWPDVELNEQPLGGARSSSLFSLMGVPTRYDLAYVDGTFEPVVDRERGLPPDLSPALAEVWHGWSATAVCPGYLGLEELEAFPWDRTFRLRLPSADAAAATELVADEPRVVSYRDWGLQLVGLVPKMRRLGGAEHVRLVFWFDW